MDKPRIVPPEAASSDPGQVMTEGALDHLKQLFEQYVSEGFSSEDAAIKVQMVASLTTVFEAANYASQMRNIPHYTKALSHAYAIISTGLGVEENEIQRYWNSVNAAKEALELREKLLGRR